MYVDASVMVAILLGEPDADTLVDRMADAENRQTSVISAFETVMAVGRKTRDGNGAINAVQEFLVRGEIVVAEAGGELLEGLHQAHLLYGKGPTIRRS